MTAQHRDKRRLVDKCQYLKGVGPAKAQKLRNLGIETVNDLLTHFPRKYYDRRNLIEIKDLQVGVEASFCGRVLSVAQPGTWRRRRPRTTAAIGDDTGIVQAVWFNQPYLARHLKAGTRVVLSGELSYYRGSRQIVNPEYEVLGDELDREVLHAGRIVPVYPLTAGVSQRFMRDLIARTLESYGGAVYENLPARLRSSEKLCTREEALRGIHFPEDNEAFERAVHRLKIEELFNMQLLLAVQRERRRSRRDRPSLSGGSDLSDRFISTLPFELTPAQKRVLDEIHADLESAQGMHRLLQGDVGSGKTIVAGAAMLAAVASGYQAALMVPTEILALQHARTLRRYFDALGVHSSLLIGSLKPADKRAIHHDIASGTTQVVIGTHALIQDEVRFAKLGVVVIDEQHRFGVRQRAALLTRNGNPHILVMTATPIPRTLALTAYADLDLSVIDELPPGRAPVTTRVVPSDKRQAMYEYVRDEVAKDARAYLLYPVIDETEKQDLEAAVSAYEELSGGVFRGVPMAILHGRLTFSEKEEVMRGFAAGRIRVLVTTTVVEVGVDVPEATIMIIHHPERFGLSQLHQLRGRVGRGGRRGFCFLPLVEDVSHDARDRLHVMTRFSDGFRIAEEDLKIRGPGEFFGVRQHGVPGLKIANPAVDGRIVEVVRRHVKRLVAEDPNLERPESRPCRRFLADVSDAVLERAVG